MIILMMNRTYQSSQLRGTSFIPTCCEERSWVAPAQNPVALYLPREATTMRSSRGSPGIAHSLMAASNIEQAALSSSSPLDLFSKVTNTTHNDFESMQ